VLSTQPPIQLALSPGVKQPELKPGQSLPSDAEDKNAWRYTSISPCNFMAWCLVEYWEYYTFAFTNIR
jgi:hypothetical protein